MLFEKLATHCEKIYGINYDHEEEFFECPECGELIYKDDWDDIDFCFAPWNNFPKKQHYRCPICETHIAYF